MSCCISSAVCCVFFTSSMSGVALGYNYSLAEYIDMKETNVSVYLKRGIFDDDVSDEDMTWRRSGGKPLKGHVRDDGDLLTAPPDQPEQMPVNSGRRLDDTILESDNRNHFEGSLIKLTATPPHPSTTSPPILGDQEMAQVGSSYQPGSIDQLKAIQSIINMRKSAAARDPTDKKSTYGYDERYLPHFPGFPADSQSRRAMAAMNGPGPDRPEIADLKHPTMAPVGPYINPARYAVPSDVSAENWFRPRIKPEIYQKLFDTDDDPPPFPKPVTYKTGPIRPTISSTAFNPIRTTTQVPQQPDLKHAAAKEIEDLKARIGEEKNIHEEKKDKKPTGPMIVGNDNTDYYEDAMKGLPVRKKRSINKIKAKLPIQQDLSKAMPQKNKPGVLIKFKGSGSASNEITDFPSILVSKLHFSNKALSNETTSTNEKGERNGAKTVGVTDSGSWTIKDSPNSKVLKIIQSMFS